MIRPADAPPPDEPSADTPAPAGEVLPPGPAEAVVRADALRADAFRDPARDVRDVRDVIGWREWVALPGLGVARIKAKVDTGARSSALHAWNLEEFQRDGVRMVRFVVHPWQRDVATSVVCECEWIGERSVRSSHGHIETRPVVRTTIELGGRRWPLELTLTNRDTMGFRMLLGRLAVRARFLVDPNRSFVQPRPRGRGGPRRPAGTETAPA